EQGSREADLRSGEPALETEGCAIGLLGAAELACLEQRVAIRLVNLGDGAVLGLRPREEGQGALRVAGRDPRRADQIVDERAVRLDPPDGFGLLFGAAAMPGGERRPAPAR